MLTWMDDYFAHQIVDTFDHVGDSDPRFCDRLYFNVHDKSGGWLLDLGLGSFPNQNVMDGFVAGVKGSLQHNIRLARPVRNDRDNMNVGPLHIEILEPLKVWRLSMDKNQYGVAFDLLFRARADAFEHQPKFERNEKQVVWHQQHYQQSGHYEGWVEIGGERMTSPMWGSRDRSWGKRGPMPGTQHPKFPAMAAGGWLSAQFDDYAIHGWFAKDAEGKLMHADGAIGNSNGANGPRFRDWDCEITGRDKSGATTSLRLQFQLSDGSSETVEAFAPKLFRDPQGNGYNSGAFGAHVTDTSVDGEVWQLDSDDYVRRNGSMKGEVLCEFRHNGNVGIGSFITPLFARFSK